jgi:hypothetical protein
MSERSLPVVDAARWRDVGAVTREGADVVVVGGGIAGVAAALSARRAGSTVTLLEKEIALGGLATLGNVVVYLPLCDGEGRQVIGGVAEELLKLAAAQNGRSVPGLRPDRISIPACWARPGSREERKKSRYIVELNPASYVLALEELLVREGVRLAYDTRFVGVSMSGARVSAVVAADKGGLFSLPCAAVVDATGDADVCVAAGEDTESCGGNVRAGWYYYTSGGELRMERLSDPMSRDPAVVPPSSMGFECRDGQSVTAHVLEYRKKLRARLEQFRGAEGAKEVYPMVLPGVPCFRMTRRLRGRAEPTAARALEPCADLVGLAGDWRQAGPVYHLAFGCLVGRSPNLLAVGRCMSVGNDLWDATRAIPVCALTGQAAGVAAAAARAAGVDPADVAIGRLQEELRARGAILSI